MRFWSKDRISAPFAALEVTGVPGEHLLLWRRGGLRAVEQAAELDLMESHLVGYVLLSQAQANDFVFEWMYHFSKKRLRGMAREHRREGNTL